jgi:signal peptidase I
MEKQSDSVVSTALDAWAEAGKRSVITVTGQSMRPLLRDGAAVVIEHGATGIGFGDVVLFRQKETLMVHRVVRVCTKGQQRQYMTKGDRCLRYDPQRLDEDQIIGRLIGVVKGKKVTSWQTTSWKIVGVLLASCSFLVGVAFTLMKRVK